VQLTNERNVTIGHDNLLIVVGPSFPLIHIWNIVQVTVIHKGLRNSRCRCRVRVGQKGLDKDYVLPY